MFPKDKDFEVNFNLKSNSIDIGGETNPFKFQNKPSNADRNTMSENSHVQQR